MKLNWSVAEMFPGVGIGRSLVGACERGSWDFGIAASTLCAMSRMLSRFRGQPTSCTAITTITV